MCFASGPFGSRHIKIMLASVFSFSQAARNRLGAQLLAEARSSPLNIDVLGDASLSYNLLVCLFSFDTYRFSSISVATFNDDVGQGKTLASSS